MESTWSAALVLLIVGVVDPSLSEDNGSSLQIAHAVLDEMSSRGNRVAAYRKAELLQLQATLQTLAMSRPDPTVDTASVGQDSAGMGGGPMSHSSSNYLQTEWAFENGHLDAVADSLNLAGLDWLGVDSLDQLDPSLL